MRIKQLLVKSLSKHIQEDVPNYEFVPALSNSVDQSKEEQEEGDDEEFTISRARHTAIDACQHRQIICKIEVDDKILKETRKV